MEAGDDMAQIVLLGTLFSEEQTKELQKLAERNGYSVLDMRSSEDERILKECEILCGRCSEQQLKNAKKLRWIQLTAAGVDGMSAESIYPHDGIILTNATGVFGTSIAEHLLMGTLMLLRKMPQYICQQRKKQWERVEGLRFLHGSKVTVLGTGDLGGTFAEYCRALGAIPTGVSRSGLQKEPFLKVYTSDQIIDAVKEADIVVSCLPGTRETEGIISAEVISSMQPGVLFLNAGRGRTVDEKALIEALKSGHVGGAVLDVFRQEPLPEDSPLWELENVIVTPHMSGSGFDMDHINRIFELFRDNLSRYFAGETLQNVVDRKREY